MEIKLVKRILVCVTALMLSAVSCSEVKQAESIPDTSINTSDSAVSEEKEDIVLTYAYYNDLGKEFNEMVKAFNEENNGYKVELKDYSDMLIYEKPEFKSGITDESLAALKIEIYQDIIKGEIDIVSSSVMGEPSSFEIMKNQGAFVDLYQFMENDPDVNRSTLNETILRLRQHRIYTISGCDDMKNPSAKVQRDRNVFNYLSQGALNQTVRDFLSAR